MSDSTVPEQWADAVENIITIIDSYTGLQVVERSISHSEVSFLCRQRDLPKWRSVSARFLLAKPEDWQIFIGQRLVKTVRQGQSCIVDPWYLGFKSEDVVGLLQQAGALFIRSAGREEAVASGAAPFSVPVPAQPAPGKRKQAPKQKVDENTLPVHPITINASRAPRVVERDAAGFKKTYERPTREVTA